MPWASAHDKFVTSIAGNTTPDVAEVGTTWTPEFGEAGALMDLTDMVEGSDASGDLVEGLVTAGTVDDALYGMPWYAGVRSVVYRTDVFEEVGVDQTHLDVWYPVQDEGQVGGQDGLAAPAFGGGDGDDPALRTTWTLLRLGRRGCGRLTPEDVVSELLDGSLDLGLVERCLEHIGDTGPHALAEEVGGHLFGHHHQDQRRILVVELTNLLHRLIRSI